MHPVLRLYEDVLSSAENVEFRLAALPRFIFVVHGSATIDGRVLNEGEAWQGSGATKVKPGKGGVTVWRWELARGDQGSTVACAPGMITHEKLSAYLETMPKGDLLMRGDCVSLPPGGTEHTHVHHGPGIRCLLEGGIRIDTHGRSTSYGPGGAWYESGPDAVSKQGAAGKATRFIRVAILPRALAGRSAVQYVNGDTQQQPQDCKTFAEAPIEFTGKR